MIHDTTTQEDQEAPSHSKRMVREPRSIPTGYVLFCNICEGVLIITMARAMTAQALADMPALQPCVCDFAISN